MRQHYMLPRLTKFYMRLAILKHRKMSTVHDSWNSCGLVFVSSHWLYFFYVLRKILISSWNIVQNTKSPTLIFHTSFWRKAGCVSMTKLQERISMFFTRLFQMHQFICKRNSTSPSATSQWESISGQMGLV